MAPHCLLPSWRLQNRAPSDFHGGGYEYHRNTVLNARQFGADTRPKNLQNDFGFHLGGPGQPELRLQPPEGPANSRYLKNQFMGCNGTSPNVICANDPRLQNSLAKARLKYVPDPNKPGIFNNYLAPTPVPDTILAQTNYWLIKGDYYFREKDHFAATIWYQGAPPKYASVFPIQIASESMSFPQFPGSIASIGITPSAPTCRTTSLMAT